MTEPTFLDGNAAAGALGEVFAVDVTAAVGRCDGCGAVAVLAEARVFVDAPGAVRALRRLRRGAAADGQRAGPDLARPARPVLPPARHPRRPLTRHHNLPR